MQPIETSRSYVVLALQIARFGQLLAQDRRDLLKLKKMYEALLDMEAVRASHLHCKSATKCVLEPLAVQSLQAKL